MSHSGSGSVSPAGSLQALPSRSPLNPHHTASPAAAADKSARNRFDPLITAETRRRTNHHAVHARNGKQLNGADISINMQILLHYYYNLQFMLKKRQKVGKSMVWPILGEVAKLDLVKGVCVI